MKELLAALLLFISAETNYNTDLPMPNIVHLDQKELEEKYYKIPKDLVINFMLSTVWRMIQFTFQQSGIYTNHGIKQFYYTS